MYHTIYSSSSLFLPDVSYLFSSTLKHFIFSLIIIRLSLLFRQLHYSTLKAFCQEDSSEALLPCLVETAQFFIVRKWDLSFLRAKKIILSLTASIFPPKKFNKSLWNVSNSSWKKIGWIQMKLLLWKMKKCRFREIWKSEILKSSL